MTRTALFRAKGLDLRFPKSAHDNPLRRIGRDMAALAAAQIRVARSPKLEKTATGALRLKNAERREKALIRTAYREVTGRRMSGRAWRNYRKAMNRTGVMA